MASDIAMVYWIIQDICVFFYTCVVNNNCTDYCHNGGTCISPGVCICTIDWSGHNCTIRMWLVYLF